MGRTDGQPQTQDPRGLRTLPPRHPRRACPSHHPEVAHRRAGCGESPPVRFGKGTSEKDPNHGHLVGGLLHTDRVAMRGPNGADLWWSGKHKHHGGNTRVPSHPDGIPLPGLGRTPRPGARHHLREEGTRPARRTRRRRKRRTAADAHRPRLPQPVPGDPPPAQKTQGRGPDRGADHVQQGHPWRTRRDRSRERTVQADLRGPADGQPQPDTHRRHRQSRTRPTPPRTRPPPARRLDDVKSRYAEHLAVDHDALAADWMIRRELRMQHRVGYLAAQGATGLGSTQFAVRR